MASVRRITKKTSRKAPKVFSRRSRTGLDAAPMKSFLHCLDYMRLEADKKDIATRMKKYIKENYPKEEQLILLAGPDWVYATSYGAVASLHWRDQENEYPQNWDGEKSISIAIRKIRERALRGLAKESDSDERPAVQTRSPMEIVKDRASDFIGAIEEVLDTFNTKTYVDWAEYSIYNELAVIDAPYFIGKKVADYYRPIADEYRELVEKKTPDLVEGYGHLKIKQRKEFLNILDAMVADAEKYMMSKKAVRKTRAPKVLSAFKQVEKVTYMKQSDEHKVTSVSPDQMIGAGRILLFNTKQRLLTELVSDRVGGFQMRGTTVYGWDVESSRTVRLRKPEEFLPIVLTKTPRQYDKEWEKLTTKSQVTNGRINKDTIILRVMDK